MKLSWLLVLAVGALALGNEGMVAFDPVEPKLSPSALPGTVTDLRVLAVSDTSVALSWTEVASNNSAIAKYQVRGDTADKFKVVGFWTSPAVCDTPVFGSTVAGGKTRSCVVRGLTAHLDYAFQVVAFTGTYGTATNFGGLSNRVDVVTAERVGPMLVLRPRGPGPGDSMPVRRVWISYYPKDTFAFPLRGWFDYGGYTGMVFGPGDSIVARGYLLLVKP